MNETTRRYDIDWLRVVAIFLLLIYHISIGFQSWGIMIGFIANDTSWDTLWIPMSMLNVWRIPLLFFVSGMGVYFSIQKRSWKQLLQERAGRILVPFLFGCVAIVPVSTWIWQHYYSITATYWPNPGHLWFLGNIFGYVLIALPVLFYLKNHEDSKAVKFIRLLFSTPLGLFPFVGVFIAEALIVKPYPYEMYAMTWHGFFLGFFAFFFGFCFVLAGKPFWNMINRWRWLFVSIATTLFFIRLFVFKTHGPLHLLVIESDSWILSALAFSYRYINRSGRALEYLSKAVYPVYMLHMIFLFLASSWLFPMNIDVHLKFLLVVILTFSGCFASYEVIRRIPWIRALFGMKR